MKERNLRASVEMIDIGANLTNAAFRGRIPQTVAQARAAQVRTIVVTGTSLGASRDALALTKEHPEELYSTAGIHPHHAREFKAQSIDTLRELLLHSAVVAVGECGLDYNRDFSPRGAQRKCFAAQLALARELDLPLFLHERDAHGDFLALLDEHPGLQGVVHCFTGTEAELDAYLERGLAIGVTGFICNPQRGRHVRELIPRIPPERLMIETDAPFMLPPHVAAEVKRRNEPKYLHHVAEEVARCTGRPFIEVCRQTTEAAQRFFRLPERPAS